MSSLNGEMEAEILHLFEDILVRTLERTDVVCLRETLYENVIEVRSQLSSVDDNESFEKNQVVRYLLRRVCESVRDNRLVWYSFLDVLKTIDKDVAEELVIRKELGEQKQTKAMEMSRNCQSIASVGNKRSHVDYTDHVLSKEDVPVLTELLACSSDKLQEIGVSLGLHNSQLVQCQKECSNIVGLSKVLLEWIRSSNEPCTVNRLKRTLCSNTVALKNMAAQLDKHFINPCILEGAKKPCFDNSYDELQCISCGWNTATSSQCTKSSGNKPIRSFDRHTVHRNHSELLSYRNYFSNLYAVKNEVPKDSWPPVTADKFINLALVSKQKQKCDDFAYAVQGDMDDIIEAKEKVEYEEVLREYERGTLVLVEGRPGSGKTTLMHKVTKDWALKRNVLRNAEIVVLVPIRLFGTSNRDITMSDIFEKYVMNIQKRNNIIADIEEASGEGVCFIVDGLDEYEYHYDYNTFILQLIGKQLLPFAMVIVASRPVGTASVRNEAPVSERIEVLGFKKDQILEYVNCYYKEDQSEASKLILYLNAHINVFRMCYLPVHAAMICFLYSKLRDNIPQTETKIYESFTRFTLFRKLKSDNPQHRGISSLQYLPEALQEYFSKICELAFDMIICSRQVVLQSQTQFSLPSPGSDKSSLGLVTIDSTAELFGIEDLYAFLHLTFQEYLAAFYLSGVSEEQVISKTKDTQANLQHVWKFYCGMVTFNKDSLFLNYILSNTAIDSLYKIQCAFESQQPFFCDAVFELDKMNNLSLRDNSLIPTDFLAISYIITNTQHKISTMAFTDCSFDREGVELLTERLSSDCLSNFKNFCYHKKDCPVVQFEALNVLLRKLTSIESIDLQGTELGVMGIKKLTDRIQLPNLSILKVRVPLKRSRSDEAETWKLLRCGSSKLNQVHYMCPNSQSYMKSHNHESCSYVHTLKKAFNSLILYNSRYHMIDCINFAFEKVPLHTKTIFQQCYKLLLINCCITDTEVKLLVECISVCSDLNTLHLDFNRITGDGAEILSNCLYKNSKLEIFSAHCNQIDNLGALTLIKALIQLSTIKVIDLQCNPITNEGENNLMSAVQTVSNVQLYVSNNNSKLFYLQESVNLICDKHFNDMTVISNALKCSKLIPEINLSTHEQTSYNNEVNFQLNLKNQNMPLLAEGLKCCTNLQTLDLNRNSSGSDGAVALAEGLKCCTNLQTLDLSRNSIGPNGAFALAEGLKCCTNLQTLDLSRNKIGPNGAVALAEGLKCCTNLQTLDLNRNSIGPNGAVALAEGLKCCTNLQTLDLSRNSIGSNGAVALAEGLKCCTNLQTLNLISNSIGSDGAVALAEKLKFSTNLRELDLTSNTIDSYGETALKDCPFHVSYNNFFFLIDHVLS